MSPERIIAGSSDFALINCLPFAISSNFRRQETDFGSEHTLNPS
jgi:hypothetical protein